MAAPAKAKFIFREGPKGLLLTDYFSNVRLYVRTPHPHIPTHPPTHTLTLMVSVGIKECILLVALNPCQHQGLLFREL